MCGRSTGTYTNLGDLQRDLRGLSPTPPNKKKKHFPLFVNGFSIAYCNREKNISGWTFYSHKLWLTQGIFWSHRFWLVWPKTYYTKFLGCRHWCLDSIFSAVMARKRFVALSKNLLFINSRALGQTDPLQAVSPTVDIVVCTAITMQWRWDKQLCNGSVNTFLQQQIPTQRLRYCCKQCFNSVCANGL
jgi:hypothetical protein